MLEDKGTVMALDLGGRRIGVALSDPTQTIASAHSVVHRTSRKEDFDTFLQIMAENGVVLLVIGLPTKTDGSDSETAVWIREYADRLAEQVDVPMTFWDESYTTVQAEDSLRQRGKRGKKIKERVDAVAAAFILQSYLDAHTSLDHEVNA